MPLPRWSALRGLVALLAAVLIGAGALSTAPALASGVTVEDSPAASDDSPTPTDSPTPPADSPTPTPSEEAPESPTPPPSQAPPSWLQPPPPSVGRTEIPPHAPVLRVRAYASSAMLGDEYWSGTDGTAFTITVKNTGTVAAKVDVSYTVPNGVTDSATGACQGGHCSISSLSPGASVPLTVAITVSPDAWRAAPLAGQFGFTATGDDARVSSGQRPWSIVFPAGPPVPDIDLRVENVALGTDPDVPGQLRIKVANAGHLPAAASVDVVVPNGVSQGSLPTSCQQRQRLDGATTRCVLGTLTPGAQESFSVPLTVDARARADAPLAGLVRATLTPSGQDGRTTQASYQILVPAGQTGVDVGSTASDSATPLGNDHDEEYGSFALTPHNTAAWPIIAVSTVVLIGVIVALVIVLRGRPVTAAPRFAGGPAMRNAAGLSGPTAPVRRYLPDRVPAAPQPVAQPAAQPVAQPAVEPIPVAEAPASPVAEAPAVPAGPEAGPKAGGVVGAEPTGPVELEWTRLPDSPPPSDPAGGDAGTGDAGTGDAGTGDAGTGDAGTGDAGTGDAGTGDAGTGDAGSGDAITADPGDDGGAGAADAATTETGDGASEATDVATAATGGEATAATGGETGDGSTGEGVETDGQPAG
ncbi:hypothetical protein GCM10023322_03840 [Rugosimonospora acidiphila]|uniref:DUF11 domain-containing protein n=1 Tax=Rugosimonospora acidiphila TaxID=556531 RepID=A0ABP9RHM7_9ACTN